MTFFCGRSLGEGRKIPLNALLTLAVKFVCFFNNNWRNSDFTCICKVTHCPGPWLLFEKVNFNGRNQIGRPARALTQSLVDLTCFPPVEWLTSNMYSEDRFTVSIWSWRCIYISISAGNYFYSYNFIPTTIDHNKVYTITIHNIIVRCIRKL